MTFEEYIAHLESWIADEAVLDAVLARAFEMESRMVLAEVALAGVQQMLERKS